MIPRCPNCHGEGVGLGAQRRYSTHWRWFLRRVTETTGWLYWYECPDCIGIYTAIRDNQGRLLRVIGMNRMDARDIRATRNPDL